MSHRTSIDPSVNIADYSIYFLVVSSFWDHSTRDTIRNCRFLKSLAGILAGVDLTGSIREAKEQFFNPKSTADVSACKSLAEKLSLFLKMIKGLVDGFSSVNGTHGTPFILRFHLFEGVTTAPGVGIQTSAHGHVTSCFYRCTSTRFSPYYRR